MALAIRSKRLIREGVITDYAELYLSKVYEGDDWVVLRDLQANAAGRPGDSEVWSMSDARAATL
jgi:hypothetical protein